MRLLIDENVPSSVADFLASRGHDVQHVRSLFPAGTPDPVIATLGDQLSATVVTWDKDFKAIVRRIPKGKQHFRRLGRISFQCDYVRGLPLIEEWIDLIEFQDQRGRAKSLEFRLIVVIQESGCKFG